MWTSIARNFYERVHSDQSAEIEMALQSYRQWTHDIIKDFTDRFGDIQDTEITFQQDRDWTDDMVKNSSHEFRGENPAPPITQDKHISHNSDKRARDIAKEVEKQLSNFPEVQGLKTQAKQLGIDCVIQVTNLPNKGILSKKSHNFRILTTFSSQNGTTLANAIAKHNGTPQHAMPQNQ